MNTTDNFIMDDADLESIDKIVSIGGSSGLSQWSVDDYRNEIRREDTIFRKCCYLYVEVVGFIVGRKVPAAAEENGYDAEIYNIAVDAGFRRIGIGSMILNDFLHISARKGLTVVWLEVRRNNETAIEFYKRAGFSEITARRSFYTNPVEDAIVMNRRV